jgi:hypothetical protein
MVPVSLAQERAIATCSKPNIAVKTLLLAVYLKSISALDSCFIFC